MKRFMLAGFLLLAACAGGDVTPLPDIPTEQEAAAAAPQCPQIGDILGAAIAAVPGSQPYADLTGAAATRFVDAYNSTPPASNETADRIIALLHPAQPVVFVIFVNDGCVTSGGAMPKDHFDHFRAGGE
jgi:hypothetical protein